jgi:hypothetical protein
LLVSFAVQQTSGLNSSSECWTTPYTNIDSAK